MDTPTYNVIYNLDDPEGKQTFNTEGRFFPDIIYSQTGFTVVFNLTQYDTWDQNKANRVVGPFDLTGFSTANLYIKPKNNILAPTSIATGSVSGTPTDGILTFVVDKDTVSNSLAQFTTDSNPTPIVLYFVAESATNQKISLETNVRVMDINRDGNEEATLFDAATLTFTPEQSAKWTGQYWSAPDDIAEALDKLARVNHTDRGIVLNQLATPPGSPTDGDAYLVIATATGDWVGLENSVVEWNSTAGSWLEHVPREGDEIYDQNGNNKLRYDGAAWGAVIGMTAAEQTKLGHITVTQAVDLDTMESDIATNTAKVTNATHTGEVTGSGALTVDKTAISNKTLVTAATGDHLLAGDASDTDNLKKVTAQTIADLKVTELSEDTSPQLSGSLDVNGNKIVSTANGDIDIEPNGTGNVLLGNFTFDADQTVGVGQDNYVLTYDNAAGHISLEAATGGSGALNDLTDVTITSAAQGDLFYRNATEWVNLGAGTSGQFLQTQGAGANPQWSTPAGSGDVVGPASATDNGLCTFDLTTGKLIQDNTGVTVDDSGNFAGVGSINDNGSGGNNNCIGDGAGAALTTGANNTLIGDFAGDLITTGGNNSAFGSAALDANVSSSYNTAVGAYSLSASTGGSNTAIGYTSLFALTTGANNTAIGFSSGRYISGGVTANQTSITSTYLGESTKAGADGNSNETVIGYDATGNGSNTCTLGNNSVTDVFVGSDNLQTLVAAGTDNDQTGTTYTLVLADQENTTVWMNNASANTLTIPLNATVAFAVGTKIAVMQEGAGQTTIDIATGGTINGTLNGSVVINNQYQGATLVKRATDTWIILGDVT